jgi:hypothetical protein
MPVTRKLHLAVLTALATSVALVGSAFAQAHVWTVLSTRGTALMLDEEGWRELERGMQLAATSAMRTLQSGRIEIDAGGDTIAIGPNTTLELFTNAANGTSVIRQYSGMVTVRADDDAGGSVSIEAQALVVTLAAGEVSVKFVDNAASVEVGRGSAAITDLGTGQRLLVGAGQTVTDAGSGPVVAAAGAAAAPDGANGGPEPGSDGTWNGLGTGSGNGGGIGNGNGTGSGPGNGPSSGSGNVSGSGSGSGGGSGSGDSNAGSNGNGSSNSSDRGSGGGN